MGIPGKRIHAAPERVVLDENASSKCSSPEHTLENGFLQEGIEADRDYPAPLNLKPIFFTCQTIGSIMMEERWISRLERR